MNTTANLSALRRISIMSIARITEISSTSGKSFEDAIQSGIARATQTLRNVRSAWVKEQQIRIDNGNIVEYQVNLMITFILDEGDQSDVA
jgi:flavin-binding protein dodecin